MKYIGPHKQIPSELLSAYTMENKIPIVDYFIKEDEMDDKRKERSIWTTEKIDFFLKSFTIERIENNTQGFECYPGAAKLLISCLKKHNTGLKNVAVIGSIDPWVESICLNVGINDVTTVEYNVPKCSDKRIKTINYFDFLVQNEIKYDLIISYSSIEHSGLGRYGDPLNPDGDLETMQDVLKKLKDTGLFIWAAPVGSDTLVWNAHRIYGKIRLPYIFQGFEIIDWYGSSQDTLFNRPKNSFEQPIIVLKKKL